jgi:hypothetical protein
MESDQRNARIFGVLFLITFLTSIPALGLYQPVLDDPAAYIAGGGLTPPLSREGTVPHRARRSVNVRRFHLVSNGSAYYRLMAIDFEVQRLQIGDVIRTTIPEQTGDVEATVVRDIVRTESTVQVTLRVAGGKEFVREWPLGEMVTVVRGP